MPNSEKRTCQNCGNSFVIDAQDFAFYEKISPSQIFAKGKNLGGQGVPAPTWCWNCRLQRKMIRRNERALYRRECDNCGNNIISMYPEDSSFKIYCNSCWWSDDWNSLVYGSVYNFSKSFFEQFRQLSMVVPRLALYQKGNVNSQYTNHADHNKNCYLAFNNGFIEDSMYCKWGVKSKDIIDCYSVFNSELVYQSQDSENCARCAFVYYSRGCLDSAFLFNCKGCQDCFLCSNLRNKKYCFANKQYTKEEYQKKVSEIDIGGSKVLEKMKSRFFNEVLAKTIRKYAIFDKVVNSLGDNLYECKNIKQGFHVYKSQDSAFCVDSANLKDCYDTYESAFSCERQYECHGCNRTSLSKFSSVSYDSHHLEYCEMCHNCSDLFGCVGLRHKQYCILNKQYTKEEYEELVPKIIEHMNEMPYISKNQKSKIKNQNENSKFQKKQNQKEVIYRYGEFFPPELSPFAYNETIAQEYFPLTKQQALDQGYRWKDPEPRDYEIDIKTEDLPDNIKDVPDDIVGKVIQCASQSKGSPLTPLTDIKGQPFDTNCTTAFKIIPQELDFYRKMGLPLPRYCPNCRHYQRLKQRNPLKLWQRQCQCGGEQSTNGVYQNTTEHFHGKQPCPNTFQTTYSPDRPEIVYCQECYQREVV